MPGAFETIGLLPNRSRRSCYWPDRDWRKPFRWDCITAAIDSHDITVAIEAAEPIDSTEAKEPIEPIEQNEPTLPMDSTEFFEPIESTESLDQSERIDDFLFFIPPSVGLSNRAVWL